MLNLIINWYRTKKIKKHLDKDFDFMMQLFAIVTYLDKEVKDIEIIDSDLLIDKLIRKKYTNLDSTEINLLKDLGHKKYIDSLKKFKIDEEYFELKKQESLSTIRRKDDKNIKDCISMIINSDGIVSNEESSFINEIKLINKE